MTEVELRDHVGDLLDGWTACEVVGPNFDADDGWPDVTGDPETPATLLTYKFDEEEPENENGFAADFEGGEIWRGSLMVTVWTEKELGDLLQRTHMRDLRKTFLVPSTANATNFAIGSPSTLGEVSSERGFVGREMEWPYVRMD